MDTLQVLFAMIRNDAPQQIWSRGVELARGNTVTEVEPGDAEVELRVKAAAFAGQSRVAQQRTVYAAISHLMKGETAPVHAIDKMEILVP